VHRYQRLVIAGWRHPRRDAALSEVGAAGRCADRCAPAVGRWAHRDGGASILCAICGSIL